MTDETKKTTKKKEQKYTLLELIRESETDNNVIIGVLNDEEYKTYCTELINDSYGRENEPIITKKEFDKIIKKIGV